MKLSYPYRMQRKNESITPDAASLIWGWFKPSLRDVSEYSSYRDKSKQFLNHWDTIQSFYTFVRHF